MDDYINRIAPDADEFDRRIIRQILSNKINNCSACCGTGKVVKYVNRTIITKKCVCVQIVQQTKEYDERMAESRIPARYRNASVGNWSSTAQSDEEKRVNDASISLVKAYVNDLPRMRDSGLGLYFNGPNGVGKTYLACAVLILAAATSYSVVYISARDLVDNMTEAWGSDAMKETMDLILQRDFIVIDELDKVYKTKTGLEINAVDSVIRRRLQDNKCCIITSNRTLKDVSERYGPHISSMISESCAEVFLLGTDARRQMFDVQDQILNG